MCARVCAGGQELGREGTGLEGQSRGNSRSSLQGPEPLPAGSSSPPVVLTQCPFLFPLSLLELTSHLSERPWSPAPPWCRCWDHLSRLTPRELALRVTCPKVFLGPGGCGVRALGPLSVVSGPPFLQKGPSAGLNYSPRTLEQSHSSPESSWVRGNPLSLVS